MLEINPSISTLHQFKPMKKNLFFAVLLCSISFAGKAATNETKVSPIAKKSMAAAIVTKPVSVKKLYEITFDCPKQGWSIGCYGYTELQAAQVYLYYQANLDC